MGSDARNKIDEARTSVTEAASTLTGDVKAAIEAGREAFRHDGDPHEVRPASRVAQMLGPTPPAKP